MFHTTEIIVKICSLKNDIKWKFILRQIKNKHIWVCMDYYL